MKQNTINFPLLFLAIIVTCGLAFWGVKRLDIDTDVVKSLPASERVISDALEIFANHPIHDQVAVDIMINADKPDVLVDCGEFLQNRMRQSGLFTEVGMGEVSALIPELATQVVKNLPFMFSQEELEQSIAPRLQKEAIHQQFLKLMEGMGGLEGIGQASFISSDPLALKDLVLAKLIQLAPSPNATMYRGHLLAKDGRHLLITGRPVTASTNTASARKLSELFAAAATELTRKYRPSGIQVTVTPAGAFRAALDNEEIIRHDVQLALGLTTAGIVLLLLFAFPRPLIGLLTLVPTLAGTAMALFVYSLLHSSISIMVLGFSGALISIMDDHSITFLHFLDRPFATRGKHASKEVQSIGGAMALCTTIGAFIVLSFSGFPVFSELGQFTALGFLFTYLFIHFIFPKIVPVMPSAGDRVPPLRNLARVLFNAGKPGALVALLIASILLFFAKPQFHIRLSDMNTVSDGTLAADRLFTEVWGDFGKKIYLMNTASSVQELQQQNDRLLTQLEKDIHLQRISSTFSPSMIFPGPERSTENLTAWRNFWKADKVAQLKKDLAQEGASLGFTAEAFHPFFAQLSPSQPVVPSPPSPRFNNLLGINAEKRGQLIQFITVSPGNGYDASTFMTDYGRNSKVFDANYFSVRLADILFSTFSSLLIIIAVMVTLLLFLQFLNWQLTLITLSPLVFAYICTLGTLHLIGHPLDIPGLMLSVVILGMGVNYSIYTVCGCQWYGNINHPSHVLVRSAILMAAATTLLGFGVLCFAQHSMLRSVGITSLCGIGYSLLGTFLLLPPLLQAYFRQGKSGQVPTGTTAQLILHRYRLIEAYPRMFARCKLKFDPLFSDLPDLLKHREKIEAILDIGCGYGVPACWCLEKFPEAQVIGIDPDPERIRVADRVTGERGMMIEGAAPDLPALPNPVDLILLLDMLHYLDDQQVLATLEHSHRLLAAGGIMVIRFVIVPPGRRSFYWYIEDLRVKLAGIRPCYRTLSELTALMEKSGFTILATPPTGNKELVWAVGQVDKKCPTML